MSVEEGKRKNVRGKRQTGVLPLAFFLLPCLTLVGCGYNQSGSSKNSQTSGYQWNSLYREDVQTVAVPIFTNKDFHRGTEFRLTEAVIKQLEAHAPYKVVPRERADTILEGEITNLSMGTISRDFQTNLPRETQLVMTVDFVWKDLRSGRILCQRRNMQATVVYYQTLGEGEFVGSQEAIERLAMTIVQELQADW
jgi:hypothetical protein